MKSKHTPGPWKATQFGIENHERITITSGSKTICNTGDESRLLISLGEACANAHLIAAAPELLEALRSQRPLILKMIRIAQDRKDQFLLNEATEALESLDSAIAKAKGER